MATVWTTTERRVATRELRATLDTYPLRIPFVASPTPIATQKRAILSPSAAPVWLPELDTARLTGDTIPPRQPSPSSVVRLWVAGVCALATRLFLVGALHELDHQRHVIARLEYPAHTPIDNALGKLTVGSPSEHAVLAPVFLDLYEGFI